MRTVDPKFHLSLEEYGLHAHLAAAVAALREQARPIAERLRGQTIWMINSTAEGGGVAELLRTQVSMLRELGLDVRWVVLESEDAEFFPLTKRLHNLIHAAPEPAPSWPDRTLFESPNRKLAQELLPLLNANDVVIVHDPQPLPLGGLLRERARVHLIWRCHIGVDVETTGTRAVWEFLRPYIEAYADVVFSLTEYVPQFLRDHVHIIHPGIDPLSHKNRELSLHKLIGILADADLVKPPSEVITPPFEHRAKRVQADGSLGPATAPEALGLMTLPIVTQVSRWDRLKGFGPLMEAFVLLKTKPQNYQPKDAQHARRVDALQLVLAGPDPGAIQDDPEAHEVFGQLSARYAELPAEVQKDLALLALPVQSRKENALMVNALQRASDIVVQNSLREGFGLTVAEAMWKRVPLLGSAAACGVRLQVQDGQHGRLTPDPEDADGLAQIIAEMLADPRCLDEWGRHGQRRVFDNFLVFSELRRLLSLLDEESRRKI